MQDSSSDSESILNCYEYGKISSDEEYHNAVKAVCSGIIYNLLIYIMYFSIYILYLLTIGVIMLHCKYLI